MPDIHASSCLIFNSNRSVLYCKWLRESLSHKRDSLIKVKGTFCPTTEFLTMSQRQVRGLNQAAASKHRGRGRQGTSNKSNCLYVSNKGGSALPDDVDLLQLCVAFSQFEANIVKTVILSSPTVQKVGKVTFKSVPAAAEALKELNGCELSDTCTLAMRYWREKDNPKHPVAFPSTAIPVGVAESESSEEDSTNEDWTSRTLYIKIFDCKRPDVNISNNDFRLHCQDFAVKGLQQINIIYEPGSNKPRGYAFATFTTRKAAARAMECLQETELNGIHKLQLSFKTRKNSKPPQSSTGPLLKPAPLPLAANAASWPEAVSLPCRETAAPQPKAVPPPPQPKAVPLPPQPKAVPLPPQPKAVPLPPQPKALPLSPQPKAVPLAPQPKALPLSPQPKAVPLPPQPKALPLSPQPKALPLPPQPKALPLSPQPKAVPLAPQPKGVPLSPQPKGVPLSPQPKAVPLPPQPIAVPLSPQPKAVPLPPQRIAVPLAPQPIAVPLPPQPKAVPLSPQPIAVPLAPQPKEMSLPPQPKAIVSPQAPQPKVVNQPKAVPQPKPRQLVSTLKVKDDVVGMMLMEDTSLKALATREHVKLTPFQYGYEIKGEVKACQVVTEHFNKCRLAIERNQVGYAQLVLSAPYKHICSSSEVLTCRESLKRDLKVVTTCSLERAVVSSACLCAGQDHVALVQIVVGSLNKEMVDAVVIPTDRAQVSPGHYSAALDSTSRYLYNVYNGGDELWEIGDTASLDGGSFSCSYRIQTLLPLVEQKSPASLSCDVSVKNCLSLASRMRLGSVAFPGMRPDMVRSLLDALSSMGPHHPAHSPHCPRSSSHGRCIQTGTEHSCC